ncbi:hypothetical protein GOODEAATRI_008456 [Goodea atripinnis]|uniref:Uncharacterized protein n=1 Tax=Goodea atripinnis TaxID=208336 RepID=A0ABV0NIK1_9TELE
MVIMMVLFHLTAEMVREELTVRLNDKEYKNWLKAGRCLVILKDGLLPFIDHQMRAFHGDLLNQYTILRRPCETSSCKPRGNKGVFRVAESDPETPQTARCHHPLDKLFSPLLEIGPLGAGQGRPHITSPTHKVNLKLQKQQLLLNVCLTFDCI